MSSAALAVILLCADRANGAEPIVGLRSLALGDSMRGAASGAEGVLLNPSGIALLRQYAVTGFFGFRVQTLGSMVHVSVADSVTQQRVAVGLYYNFINESPPVSYSVAEGGSAPNNRMLLIRGQKLSRNGHEVGVVSAFPLGERFILGVATKYGYYATTAQLPTDQLPGNFTPSNPAIDKDKVYDLGSLSNVVSFDVGLTIRVLESLNLGVVGQNLWGHGDEMPSLLGMGLAWIPSGRVTVAADAVLNFTGNQNCVGMAPTPCSDTTNRITVRTGGGIEYSIADKVPLRAGYVFDSNISTHSVTAGLGYFSTRFGIDFAMRQRVAGGAETLLVLGFRIFRD